MKALIKCLNRHAQVWLWVSILLTPLLAIAGGLGFQLAGFFMGLSAILALVADRTGARYWRDVWPIALIGLASWAWVSMIWSPYEAKVFGGNASLLFGLLVPLLFIPLIFLRLTERAKNALGWSVVAVGVLGVALLFIDSATNFALSFWGDPVDAGQDPEWRRGQAEMNVGRGQISYAQYIWPAAALMVVKLKRGWMLAGAVLIMLAVSAQLNNLSIVIPALLLALILAAIAWRAPRVGLTLAFSLAVASVIFAPILGAVSSLLDLETLRRLPLSWEHRLRMWAYSWDLIRQAPIFGHGFDASRAFDQLTFQAPDGRDIPVMSMHPHNIGLQIWLETGLVGVCLAAGFLLALMKAAIKTCRSSVRAFAAAGLVTATAVNGAATIGVWQHWWWALIMIAACTIILLPPEK